MLTWRRFKEGEVVVYSSTALNRFPHECSVNATFTVLKDSKGEVTDLNRTVYVKDQQTGVTHGKYAWALRPAPGK